MHILSKVALSLSACLLSWSVFATDYPPLVFPRCPTELNLSTNPNDYVTYIIYPSFYELLAYFTVNRDNYTWEPFAENIPANSDLEARTIFASDPFLEKYNRHGSVFFLGYSTRTDKPMFFCVYESHLKFCPAGVIGAITPPADFGEETRNKILQIIATL